MSPSQFHNAWSSDGAAVTLVFPLDLRRVSPKEFFKGVASTSQADQLIATDSLIEDCYFSRIIDERRAAVKRGEKKMIRFDTIDQLIAHLNRDR